MQKAHLHVDNSLGPLLRTHTPQPQPLPEIINQITKPNPRQIFHQSITREIQPLPDGLGMVDVRERVWEGTSW